MNEKTKYYLIWEHLAGKEEDKEFYLFRNGEWIPDTENVIMDHLMGYDPSEPPDSFYGIFNQSIMDEIDEITYEEAVKITGEQK